MTSTSPVLMRSKPYFLSTFLHCFVFAFGLGGIGGEVGLWRVVYAVVVGGGCGGVVKVGKNDNLQVM